MNGALPNAGRQGDQSRQIPMWSSRRSGIVFLVLLLLYVGAIALGAQLIRVSDPERTDTTLPLWRYLVQELGR